MGVKRIRGGKKKESNTYCCNLGLYALPEGFNIIDVVDGQSVPDSDHAVPDPDGEAARVHGGEGKAVDKPPKGGHGPAAIQSGQIPAFHLKNFWGTRNG